MAFSLSSVLVDLICNVCVCFWLVLDRVSNDLPFVLKIDDACLNFIESVEYRSYVAFFRCTGDWRGFNERLKVRMNVFQELHDLVLCVWLVYLVCSDCSAFVNENIEIYDSHIISNLSIWKQGIL